MPTVDKQQLADIANIHLPRIRDAINAANYQVSDASHDWASPFTEHQPEGWGTVYAETKERWVAARGAFQRILQTSAENTDRSARAMVQVSSNYVRAEEYGVQRLTEIARLFEQAGG